MILTYSVTIGEVMQVVVFVAGGVVVFVKMQSSLSSHSARLGAVETELRKQTEILVSLARQDEILKALERRLEALER